MSRRRVAVTGLGWVTSLGNDVDKVFDKLVEGRSGITRVTRWNPEGYGCEIGGEIADWNSPNLDPRHAKRLDRFGQFALNAAIDAVNDSGLDFAKEDLERCGTIIGSGIGGMEEFIAGYQKLIDGGPSRVSPFMVPKLMCNSACGNVSIHYGLKGPNFATTTACASAGHAIGEAVRSIRAGESDVIVAGGSEAALCNLGMACFVALRALSAGNGDPTQASRPFDTDRDGFVLAEGCGIIVIEELEHARARGARIYCELAGYGQSADGTHITAPDPEGSGAAAAMRHAVDDARIAPTDLSYINAHATSTGLGDAAEAKGIKRLFGTTDTPPTPVSSIKSMTGHSLGAAAGIEAVASIKMIQRGVLCPTINLDHPDPECDLDHVANTAREADVKHVLSNSFGFGGHNVALVFSAV